MRPPSCKNSIYLKIRPPSCKNSTLLLITCFIYVLSIKYLFTYYKQYCGQSLRSLCEPR